MVERWPRTRLHRRGTPRHSACGSGQAAGQGVVRLHVSSLAPRCRHQAAHADYHHPHSPDFGERFTGRKFPSLFLLLLPASPWHVSSSTEDKSAKSEIAVHQLTDHKRFPSLGFGQAVFLPSEPGQNCPRILATGYEETGDGKKLGIVYCANRPARIYELELEVASVEDKAKDAEQGDAIATELGAKALGWRAASVVPQSPEGRSARSPRVFLPPCGVKVQPLLVFISNPAGGPHSSCSSLHACVRVLKLDSAPRSS